MNKIKNIIANGVYKKNAIFVLLLGMCPSLAVTTSLTNAVGMGVSVIFILAVSNFAISLLRRFIPSTIRIPAFIGIIAAFVTIVEMVMNAYLPELYISLGIYLPLIVVNCIILERAESFASKNPVIYSVIDGIAVGIGFTVALFVISFFRELIGAGTLFGIPVLPETFMPALIMILPPGAFITLGIILAVFAHIKNKRKEKKEA
ncbi:electron transport complex subunit RsxE [endosymbiont 'TC1' of Trimyema compressum]|uniref:electron transport complex subunit RsxE n=1 Tax=endosymbiont 'TC1' of Trimyema compressum TaxID=243899 RepID=UPI0007F0709D|nr:electron transport complex subunit E [endosymbiont 'TC1' of Trimyema compressum]AMP20390.1 electron transport complex subunit RsxE [endosymbiont 'TC1' of Trimyema compressum]